jgi:hypothetical protein
MWSRCLACLDVQIISLNANARSTHHINPENNLRWQVLPVETKAKLFFNSELSTAEIFARICCHGAFEQKFIHELV